MMLKCGSFNYNLTSGFLSKKHSRWTLHCPIRENDKQKKFYCSCLSPWMIFRKRSPIPISLIRDVFFSGSLKFLIVSWSRWIVNLRSTRAIPSNRLRIQISKCILLLLLRSSNVIILRRVIILYLPILSLIVGSEWLYIDFEILGLVAEYTIFLFFYNLNYMISGRALHHHARCGEHDHRSSLNWIWSMFHKALPLFVNYLIY